MYAASYEWSLMTAMEEVPALLGDVVLRPRNTADACCCTQVVTWVPQNDLLAHPNLRAFLSHVGINSMYEVCTAPLLQRLIRISKKGDCAACTLVTPALP